VNGLSGCGKSSLVRAGVVPRLEKLGYQVVCASVITSIVHDILHAIDPLPKGELMPQDYVDALQELHDKGQQRHIVLIVDQFEQALSASHPVQALTDFVQGLARLLDQVHRFVKIVIVLRADWLYYLTILVRRFNPRLNVYAMIFTLDPLTREAAHEAIAKPLKKCRIPYDEGIIQEILDSLLRQESHPPIGPYIQPIHLQIVLDALLRLANNDEDKAFTVENLRRAGGVASILKNYLTDSMRDSPEAWPLLLHFVDRDGRTARAIRRTELLVVPAAEDIKAQLETLVAKGLLEIYAADNLDDTYYRLAHDSLAEAIADYLEKHPERQEWKRAEEWLASAVEEWCDSKKSGDGDGVLLEEDRYLFIYEHRDNLSITSDSQELLLRTSLRYGQAGLGYWLWRGKDPECCVQIVADKLLSSELQTRKAARSALAGCVFPSEAETTALGESERRSLRDKLRQALTLPGGPPRRDAAAQAQWTLHAFETTTERWRVGGIVFLRWTRDHSRQTASYLLSSLLLIMVIAGILYARERLRGSWQLFDTLIGGPTPLVVVDPIDPNTTYAITLGGPGPRQGISLFVQRGNTWQAVRYDFTRAKPTSFVITHPDTGPRYYVSLYGQGIIRSDDGGKSWAVINRGLPSFGLTSLVADPDDPNTLYAGTDDWRGVLRSSDGGDSWQFYDYKGEIFGAMVTALTYTRSGGGTLIAGTNDGRILAHPRTSSGWEMRYGLSKGAINALAVGGKDDSHVVAGTSRGIVLISQDAGQKWVVLGQPANQFCITAIAVVPDDPKRVYVGTYGNGGYTIWKSQDMGQGWEMIPGEGLPRSHISSLTVAGQGIQQVTAGTADGLYTSRNGGVSFEKTPLNAPLAAVKELAVSEAHSAPIYAVAGGTVYANLEGDLRTWAHGKGLRAELVRTVAVDPDDPYVAYAGVLLEGESSVFVTEDGGQNWRQATPPPLDPVPPDTTALALAKTQDGQTVLYAGTVGCGVLRSNDKGRSWDTFGRSRCDQAGHGDMPADVAALAVDMSNADVVYAAAGQGFFCSTDGGYSWEQHEPGIKSPIVDMVADPVEAHTVYLVTGSDGFWYSKDGGETWQKPDRQPFEGAGLTTLAATSAQAYHLIVGASNGGVWITSDCGETWHSIRENLAVSSISSVATSEALEGKVLVGSLTDGLALFTPGQLFGSVRR